MTDIPVYGWGPGALSSILMFNYTSSSGTTSLFMPSCGQDCGGGGPPGGSGGGGTLGPIQMSNYNGNCPIGGGGTTPVVYWWGQDNVCNTKGYGIKYPHLYRPAYWIVPWNDALVNGSTLYTYQVDSNFMSTIAAYGPVVMGAILGMAAGAIIGAITQAAVAPQVEFALMLMGGAAGALITLWQNAVFLDVGSRNSRDAPSRNYRYTAQPPGGGAP